MAGETIDEGSEGRVRPARELRVKANSVVLLVLLPLYYLQVAQHVAWRDEYNVWGIACVSQSLGELMHRVSYEAHPALWYLLCYAASRMTHAAWMFKLLEAVIGTGVFAAIALLGPFVWWETALVLTGFYVSFHYTVLARMYGMELLIALLYTWSRVRWPERPVRNALWLALLVNTEVTGGILACGFLVEMALERLRVLGRAAWRQIAGAVGVFVAGAVVAWMSMRPAKDIGWSSTGRPFAEFFRGEHIGSSFGKWTGLAFFPTTVNTQALWVDPMPWPHAVLLPLSLGLLIAAFWKQGRMAAMFVTVAVLGMLFADATNVSGVRHYGIEVIAFLCLMWMLRAEGEPLPPAAVALLGLLTVATVHNVAMQWERPFADDDDVAYWLHAQGLDTVPLIGTPDTTVTGVAERLQRPIYQLDCSCWDRVVTFSRRRDAFHWITDAGPRLVEGLARLPEHNGVLLMNRPLSETDLVNLKAGHVESRLLKTFDRGYVDDEHYYVYRVQAVK